jgi:hypothetical protein
MAAAYSEKLCVAGEPDAAMPTTAAVLIAVRYGALRPADEHHLPIRVDIASIRRNMLSDIFLAPATRRWGHGRQQPLPSRQQRQLRNLPARSGRPSTSILPSATCRHPKGQSTSCRL